MPALPASDWSTGAVPRGGDSARAPGATLRGGPRISKAQILRVGWGYAPAGGARAALQRLHAPAGAHGPRGGVRARPRD
eukprot:1676979-Pyramimonas_sp.AAC.1